MKINAGEIRVGMLLEYKNDLWQVLKTQHVKPGKGGAFAQVEMKSLEKNTKLNERFRSNQNIRHQFHAALLWMGGCWIGVLSFDWILASQRISD